MSRAENIVRAVTKSLEKRLTSDAGHKKSEGCGCECPRCQLRRLASHDADRVACDAKTELGYSLDDLFTSSEYGDMYPVDEEDRS